MGRRKSRKKDCVSLLAVVGAAVSLVAMIVMPASAASGTGAVTLDIAYTNVDLMQTPVCAEYTAGTFATVVAAGTVEATQSGVSATYVGPVTFTMNTTQTFYGNNLGTHGTDNLCDPTTAGDDVTIEATVSSSGVAGSVSCPTTAGTFHRDNSVLRNSTEFTWSPSCTVVDPTDPLNPRTQTVTFLIKGDQDGCIGFPPSSCKFDGTYGVS